MKENLRRFISLVLACLILLQLPGMAAPVHAEEVSAQAADTLHTAIEKQIRDYAKSINQADADDEAAMAIAKHGVTGGGKKMSVGKNHALTATLMNSNLGLHTVIQNCTAGIKVMQQEHLPSVFVDGGCNWGDHLFSTYVYPAYPPVSEEVLLLTGNTRYSGTYNDYDETLTWVAGFLPIDITITRGNVAADTATYNVSVKFNDRFDFRSDNGSIPKEIASLLGSILFNEFDWVATAEFSVTVANECTHGTENFSLHYDEQNRQMVFDDSFGTNGAQRHDYQSTSGTKTYFELDRAMRLDHDRSWVMEYTVTDPGKFVFSETDTKETTHPYFLNYDRNYLFVPIMQEFASGEYQTGYYGIDLRGKFTYNTTDSYTLKLENVIDSDGSNMIYLTVYNNTIQETVLQPTAMDDYYLIVNSSYILQDSESKELSGRDFVIRYICNKSYHFDSSSLEMKIWENGVDGSSSDYFTEKVTAPTCASEGYTTYTCSLCGYSYDGNFVESLDHQFGEWSESREPSCSVAGEEQRICAACGHAEIRETIFTEHDYVSEVVPSTCAEQGYTLHTCSVCGHSYTDTFVETTAHDMGDWVTTLDATCAAEGEKRRDCANCDYFETEKIEKIAHVYESAVTAPTCTEKGYTTHTCHCGDSYVDSYVDAGHTVVTLPAKTPTATENGLTEGEGCSGCGEVYIAQQVIPAIGSALPAGYQRVNYLESIGEAYIDTGLAALPGDKLILYAAATSSETMSMMGSGSTSASKDRVQAHHVVYRGYTLRFFGQLCDYVSIPVGQMTTFVFDLDKGEGYIDGKLVLDLRL